MTSKILNWSTFPRYPTSSGPPTGRVCFLNAPQTFFLDSIFFFVYTPPLFHTSQSVSANTSGLVFHDTQSKIYVFCTLFRTQLTVDTFYYHANRRNFKERKSYSNFDRDAFTFVRVFCKSDNSISFARTKS